MNWYSLFVVTGKEEYVAEWLQILFPEMKLTALIPKRRLVERKQGRTRQVLKKMFPGYLIINMDITPQNYGLIKQIPNLIRVLGSGEYFTRIPEEEIMCIRHLVGEGDVVDYSKVYFNNSKVVVKSGPLLGKEGLIRTVDKRKLRAKIAVQFMGLTKEIDVGIEMLEQA